MRRFSKVAYATYIAMGAMMLLFAVQSFIQGDTVAGLLAVLMGGPILISTLITRRQQK